MVVVGNYLQLSSDWTFRGAEHPPVRCTGSDREHSSETLWVTLTKKSANGRPATETVIPVIAVIPGFF